MHVRHRRNKIATFVLAAAAVACAHNPSPGTRDTICYPQQCSLEVKNDQGQMISLRYYDSTGVGDLLGSVAPATFQRFVLSRRTGRNITLEATVDKQVYRAQTKLLLPRYQQAVVHFPGDFAVAAEK